MEKAREFLEKLTTGEEADQVSRLSFPPHQALLESSFYEYFAFRGVRVAQFHLGSISFSFKVPPRLTDSNGNLAMGAIASLIDFLGAAVVYHEGYSMNVSVDMSISYISAAKLNARKKGRVYELQAFGTTLSYPFLFLFLFHLYQDELEIISRCLGGQGKYSGTHVLIRNNTTGEIVAEGRHSLFNTANSKL